jgi:hypothetical protein
MDATPLHMSQMWLRSYNKLSMWKPKEHICDIRNSTNLETNRLTFYKQGMAKLKHGKWLGNSIIDFFIWKLFNMLVKLGMKDVHKCFKIIDSGCMYYMLVHFDHYDVDACRRWVKKGR